MASLMRIGEVTSGRIKAAPSIFRDEINEYLDHDGSEDLHMAIPKAQNDP